jgi:hypothetical protein
MKEYYQCYKLLRNNQNSYIQIRRKLNSLSSKKCSFVLRAVDFLSLAEDLKFKSIPLSLFLTCNSAEILGYSIFHSSPKANFKKFLEQYGDASMLSRLPQLCTLNEFNGQTTRDVRDLTSSEMLDIYYGVARCLFTHQGERALATFERRVVNCGTVSSWKKYRENGHERFKRFDASVGEYYIIHMRYDEFRELVTSAIKRYLQLD